MKIKKFKNLWTMGLILIVVIYVVYFTIKLINPAFIVGIAELPGIVALGNYVDTHPWAYYLFCGGISFITYYLYCCACCRKRKLNYKECAIILITTIIWYVIEAYIPALSAPFNYVTLVLLPALILWLSKETDIKYLYSTVLCFTTHTLLQRVISVIKDLTPWISYPNTATITILLIDGFIWLLGLYLFYNKGGK